MNRLLISAGERLMGLLERARHMLEPITLHLLGPTVADGREPEGMRNFEIEADEIMSR
jgi:hypothetical protein